MRYWKVKNDTAEWEHNKTDPTIIISIIWTKEFGLTEYVKRDGEVLRISVP